MFLSKFSVIDSKKSRFIKQQGDASGLFKSNYYTSVIPIFLKVENKKVVKRSKMK